MVFFFETTDGLMICEFRHRNPRRVLSMHHTKCHSPFTVDCIRLARTLTMDPTPRATRHGQGQV